MKKSKKRLKLRSGKLPLLLATAVLFGIAATYLLLSAKAQVVEGIFQMHCSVHHTNKDDPIVYPGQVGAAHNHSFYGNVTTNAHTTTESLMSTTSNCARNMSTTDRSAYWVPSLYQRQSNGSLTLLPTSGQIAFIYYQRAGFSTGPKVKPFPNGLRMIAGSASATSPQPLSIVRWGCGGGGGGPQTAHIQTCSSDQPIHATIFFPSCWNGSTLDSADHKSHMAYAASNGACPSSHPVSLPELALDLDYLGVTGGPNVVLSSGGQYSMHADFFAAWDVQAQNALVAECLNIARDCSGITRNGNILSVPGNSAIPQINVLGFSTTPQTTGTLPTFPSPPPVTTNPNNSAAKPSSGSTSQTQPSTANQTPEQAAAAAAAATAQEHASHANITDSDLAATIADYPATKPSRNRLFVISSVSLLGVGLLGYAIYFYRSKIRMPW